MGYRGNLVVRSFVGSNYWQESMSAYGARCNADDVGGRYWGAPGSMAIPFGTEVINNKSMWSSLRLGTDVTARLLDHVTFHGDAVFLPAAYLLNEDSHFLRSDLGPTPHIEDSGTGWCYQLEGELKIDVNDNRTVGAGVRHWYAETGGVVDWVYFAEDSDLQDFTSGRFGVFGNVSYRFSTF